jgi:predicted AAA+ superfamily ATPase
MPEWSKWLRRIYDTEEISLCVTGSSSKMSSSGIPTELRGRFLEKSLYPLSFREFLLFKDYIFKMENIDYSEKEKALILNLLNEYLEYGGLPEIALSDEPIKVEIAKSYFQTIVKKDIVESHKIKNEEALKALLRLLLNSQKYTLNNTYNNLKSMQYIVGKGTLQSYLSHIEETYFMFSLPIFSYKIKEQSQYAKKCYFIDNIFISKLSGNMAKNKGRLYENSVAIELKRRYETFCYWENARNQEVDFVVIGKNKVSQIIQVCYDLSNFETKKREIISALHASKELNCKDIIIINESIEEKKAESWFGITRNIKYIPLWKFLTQDNIRGAIK